MCVIIHSTDKKHRPSLQTLRECNRKNPDGAGIAWVAEGKVNFLKGLTPEAIHKACSMINGALVIHFRWATAGGTCKELCHPFPITDTASAAESGSADRVLFHNGHWGGYRQFEIENNLGLNGPVSDTRVIAVGVYLGGRRFLKDIPGRFVVMSAKRGVSRYGMWYKRDGLYFSNLHWAPCDPGPAKPAPKPEPKRPVQEPLRYTGSGRTLCEAMACYGD